MVLRGSRGCAPFLLGLAVALAGCREPRALAQLIRVSALEQIWEQPNQLTLHGSGFPAGTRGEALLEGALFAAGAEPRRERLRAAVRAVSTTLALVDLDAPALLALPEGPFVGSVEVRFGAESGAPLIGRLERALFRLGGGRSSLQAQFALNRRAQDYQRSLGISALVQSEQGLSVAELAEAGSSQRAGLQVGDQIVALNGAPVQLAVDVLGRDADGARAALEIQRAGEPRTRLIQVATEHDAGAIDWALRLLACALGASTTALLARGLGARWALPKGRRERWLIAISALSLSWAALLVLQGAPPAARHACHAAALGALGAALYVYLMRRARPTLRTTRDPALTPFL